MDAPLPTAVEATKHERKLSRTWKVLIISAITVVSIAILVPVGFVLYIGITISIEESHLVNTADAGFTKAKQTIDPEQLRAWAMKETSRYATSYLTNSQWQIPESEFPKYLRDLYTDPIEDAFIVKQGNETYVQVYWGGAWFHWMFYIGSTNLTAPNDPEIKTAEWVPGIYYGREDTVHQIR
jgi:hypothetical protein